MMRKTLHAMVHLLKQILGLFLVGFVVILTPSEVLGIDGDHCGTVKGNELPERFLYRLKGFHGADFVQFNHNGTNIHASMASVKWIFQHSI
jgi:hypothetical protein